ncbi:MAG: hypothetical protein MHMPM18_002589 [Marteilia pararefringens]
MKKRKIKIEEISSAFQIFIDVLRRCEDDTQQQFDAYNSQLSLAVNLFLILGFDHDDLSRKHLIFAQYFKAVLEIPDDSAMQLYSRHYWTIGEKYLLLLIIAYSKLAIEFEETLSEIISGKVCQVLMGLLENFHLISLEMQQFLEKVLLAITTIKPICRKLLNSGVLRWLNNLNSDYGPLPSIEIRNQIRKCVYDADLSLKFACLSKLGIEDNITKDENFEIMDNIACYLDISTSNSPRIATSKGFQLKSLLDDYIEKSGVVGYSKHFDLKFSSLLAKDVNDLVKEFLKNQSGSSQLTISKYSVVCFKYLCDALGIPCSIERRISGNFFNKFFFDTYNDLPDCQNGDRDNRDEQQINCFIPDLTTDIGSIYRFDTWEAKRYIECSK